MSKVFVDVSPSADGYLAGPGVSVEEPFGTVGFSLARWLGYGGTAPTEADKQASAAMFANTGAVVLGRRMFEVGIAQWGADGAFRLPVFVVTNRPHEPVVKGPTTFTFVTDGVAPAVQRAREVAGGKDVVIAGGADVIQQCFAASLVEELRLHIAPLLLGAGTPLLSGLPGQKIELERTGLVATDLATHITYTVK